MCHLLLSVATQRFDEIFAYERETPKELHLSLESKLSAIKGRNIFKEYYQKKVGEGFFTFLLLALQTPFSQHPRYRYRSNEDDGGRLGRL
jgi:chloramphenicol O-acetyltransferase